MKSFNTNINQGMKSIKTPNSQNTGPKNNSLGTMKTLQPKLAKDDVSLQEEIHEVNAKPVIEQSTHSQNFTPLKSFTISRQPQLVQEPVSQIPQQPSHIPEKTLKQEEKEREQNQLSFTQQPFHSSTKVQNDTPIKTDEGLLTPTEFYCLHYELIKEIMENVLTIKYGNRFVQGIDNIDIRLEIESEAFNDVRDYIELKKIQNLDYQYMNEYVQIVFAEAMGLGILEFLLKNKDVDEIIVQEHDNIQAEIHGILTDTEYKFPSFDAALKIVNRIIRPLNKTLDVSNPNVDGQLPDGSRISASIPPVRAEGQISMNIRKFSEKVEPLIFYANKFQSSTPEMVEFIEALVGAKKTIIASGGTGSGKTTFLNSMTYAINKNDRIIVIEDTREIRCQVPRVEYYLVVPGNNEGYKGIGISDIMQMSQRKRPDRIFVGECRGGELNEFLNAANTGHPRSVTSIHANNPRDAFSRMENMLQKNTETKNMTHEAIQRTLSTSIDFIIQTERLVDGKRRITHVTEVLGYGDEGFTKMKQMKLTKADELCDPTRIYMKDVFYFKELNTREVEDNTGKAVLKVDGQFMATGYIPYCIRELRRKGYKFDNEFFNKRVLLEV